LTAQGDWDAGHRVECAWLLRQQDPDRGRALLQSLPASLDPSLSVRVALMACDWQYLNGDPAGADAALCDLWAQSGEVLSADPQLASDSQRLAAMLAVSLGDPRRRDAALNAALDAARCAGDVHRARQVRALQVWFLALSAKPDALSAGRAELQALAAEMQQPDSGATTGDRALFDMAQGLVAYNSGALVTALRAYGEAFTGLMATGQIQLASACAGNLAAGFDALNDLESALVWCERAFDAGRARRWPVPTGIALLRCAEVLRRLGRIDPELLDEAEAHFAPAALTRNKCLMTIELGRSALALGQAQKALRYLQQGQAMAETLGAADLQSGVLKELIQAQIALGDLSAAQAGLEEALDQARRQQAPWQEAILLRMRAGLSARHGRFEEALGHLDAAFMLALGVEGLQVDPDWYIELGEYRAALGLYELAYAASRQADRARARWGEEQLRGQAQALQVRLSFERSMQKSHQLRQRQLNAQTVASVVSVLSRDLASPLGTTLLLASTLEGKARELLSAHHERRLSERMLHDHLRSSADATFLMANSVNRAQAMLNAFDCIGLDLDERHFVRVDATAALASLVSDLQCELTQGGRFFVVELAPSGLLELPAEGLRRVLQQWIRATLKSAHHGRPALNLRLRLDSASPQQLQIVLEDDGEPLQPGQSDAVRQRAFSPTLLQDERVLALWLLRFLAEDLLAGHMQLEALGGAGSRWTWTLPLVLADIASPS
jgi:tetratricopeptide (TPR) repeat protein